MFDPRWQHENRAPAVGKFEAVIDLWVQQIGCTDLENMGTDKSLFLVDTATKHWASNNNDGHNAASSGDET